MVKNLPVMREIWVQVLGREDPPGEWNDNPLQYSCLENSMDRGAWWGYNPWGSKKSDMTECLTLSLFGQGEGLESHNFLKVRNHVPT